MMLDADNLYRLLPAVYRERDAALGVNGGPGPLRELIEVIAGQFALVDAEVDQLYDDAFIETCAQWAVPYIGDLVGYRPLNANVLAGRSPRAEVADTIRYRRWKGTVTILEQLASDVTGWSALAVEFFTRLSTNQFMNHLRLDSPGAADIRHHAIASTAGTPFDRNMHAVEVRRIRSKRGRFNIPNVGVYVWRLGAFANPDNPSNAFRLADGHYTFDPLGDDHALVNVPTAKKDPFTRTKPADVPAPLRVRAVANAGPPFGFSVYDGSGTRIPDIHVDICDLSGWNTVAGTPNPPAPYVVAVDPGLGRIWFPPGLIGPGQPVLVTYAYAFSGPYGAGFYQRTVAGTATVSVLRNPATLLPNLTMAGAIGTALGLSNKPIVEYADNVTDISATTVITIAGGETIVVRTMDRRRAVFLGPLRVDATVAKGQSATLVLEGILFGAGVIVNGSGTATGTGTINLIVRNCTVLPDKSDGDGIAWSGAGGTLTLERTLCAAIALAGDDVDASISDSAVDAGAGVAITARSVSIVRSTIFGSATVHEVGLIENAIITGTVTSTRTQHGCVRYSYLPRSSTVPQRYRCQPDGAAQAAIDLAAITDPTLTSAQLKKIGDDAAAQIVPQFTAVDQGDAAYAQLSVWCPIEITAGADDDGEMGVFHELYTAIREANLLYRLDENLRMSLEAGVLHAS
jgi:hypothetical protein